MRRRRFGPKKPRLEDTRDDSLSAYLLEISKYPLITREQEAELALRIRKGDDEAAQTLAKSNLRFVISVAKRYQNRGLSLSDLIQEGNKGLLTATRKFDPEVGVKFISYAVWWIRQAILQGLAEQSRVLRVPLNRTTDMYKINSMVNELIAERECSIQQAITLVHQSTKYPLDLIEMAVSQSQTVRLDAPYDKHNPKHTVGEHFADRWTPSPIDRTYQRDLSDIVDDALLHLDDREQKILRLYFGLDGGEPKTLEKIGGMMGVTRERIRQIKERAISRLKERCPVLYEAWLEEGASSDIQTPVDEAQFYTKNDKIEPKGTGKEPRRKTIATKDEKEKQPTDEEVTIDVSSTTESANETTPMPALTYTPLKRAEPTTPPSTRGELYQRVKELGYRGKQRKYIEMILTLRGNNNGTNLMTTQEIAHQLGLSLPQAEQIEGLVSRYLGVKDLGELDYLSQNRPDEGPRRPFLMPGEVLKHEPPYPASEETMYEDFREAGLTSEESTVLGLRLEISDRHRRPSGYNSRAVVGLALGRTASRIKEIEQSALEKLHLKDINQLGHLRRERDVRKQA